MCSDFSLKALIGNWDEEILGPKCFKKTGEFSSGFTLKFEPQTLKECPSSQLVKVGEFCDDGEATVHAMGGTIAYDLVKPIGKLSQDFYKVEVLTVATMLDGRSQAEHGQCIVGEHKGVLGHCLLHYPSGGQLLTSCGHWIELVKLDIKNHDQIFKVAEEQYGKSYVSKMRKEYKSMNKMQ